MGIWWSCGCCPPPRPKGRGRRWGCSRRTRRPTLVGRSIRLGSGWRRPVHAHVVRRDRPLRGALPSSVKAPRQLRREDFVQTTEVGCLSIVIRVDVRAAGSETLPGRDHPLADDLALPAFQPQPLPSVAPRCRGVKLLVYALHARSIPSPAYSIPSQRVPGTSRARWSDLSVAQRRMLREKRRRPSPPKSTPPVDDDGPVHGGPSEKERPSSTTNAVEIAEVLSVEFRAAGGQHEDGFLGRPHRPVQRVRQLQPTPGAPVQQHHLRSRRHGRERHRAVPGSAARRRRAGLLCFSAAHPGCRSLLHRLLDSTRPNPGPAAMLFIPSSAQPSPGAAFRKADHVAHGRAGPTLRRLPRSRRQPRLGPPRRRVTSLPRPQRQVEHRGRAPNS